MLYNWSLFIKLSNYGEAFLDLLGHSQNDFKSCNDTDDEKHVHVRFAQRIKVNFENEAMNFWTDQSQSIKIRDKDCLLDNLVPKA